jgi:hypothetical protein
MEKFVMAMLVVQVLGGAFLFASVSTTGSRSSTARATRLPPLVVFSHAMLGLLAPALWIAYLRYGSTALVWSTLVSLLLSTGGGLFMLARTLGHSDRLDQPANDPADVTVIEKQVPKSVLAGHGLVAAILIVGVLVEGLAG